MKVCHLLLCSVFIVLLTSMSLVQLWPKSSYIINLISRFNQLAGNICSLVVKRPGTMQTEKKKRFGSSCYKIIINDRRLIRPKWNRSYSHHPNQSHNSMKNLPTFELETSSINVEKDDHFNCSTYIIKQIVHPTCQLVAIETVTYYDMCISSFSCQLALKPDHWNVC